MNLYDNDKTYITKEQFYIFSAILTAQRSKDKSKKVGAILVNKKGRIVATGYNGFPNKLTNSNLPWSKSKNIPHHQTKHAYIVHAEANSILNSTVYDLSDCTMYTTLFPCCECMKLIIQKDIRNIVYIEKPNMNKSIYIASLKMIKLANIKIKQYNDIKNINLNIPTSLNPNTTREYNTKGVWEERRIMFISMVISFIFFTFVDYMLSDVSLKVGT